MKVMYWNYRRRRIERQADGRRHIQYRKGGKTEV